MLQIIQTTLTALIEQQRGSITQMDRIHYFIGQFEGIEFSRKDYLNVFQNISGATASRDLKKGVAIGFFAKFGKLRKPLTA